MKKALLTALTMTALMAPAQAQAGVMVIGSSAGHTCYQRALARDGSREALEQCDLAFRTGRLTERDQVATFVNRGIVRLIGGDHQGAIVDFDEAIKLDPKEPESYLNKGSTVIRMGGSATEAIPLLNEALELRTRKPEYAYFARAIAHELSGDITAAYRDYQRARQAAPKWRQPAEELSRFQVRRASSPN